MEKERNSFKLFTSLIILIVCASCDVSFDPFQENDQYYYSIYGYLDASADTQWVRVMPVREDLLLESKPSNATVTLEHIESGETVVMNDSLMSFEHNTYAYNFWTTMKLEPERSYRIKAVRPDGKFSSAQTILPKDFPTPWVNIEYSPNGNLQTASIFIENVDHLVDFQSVYHLPDPETNEIHLAAVSHLQDSTRSSTNLMIVNIDPVRYDLNYLAPFYPNIIPQNEFFNLDIYYGLSSIFNSQIFIASGGPDFPYFPSISLIIETLPEGISNVENGVGFLAGIVSKTIPFHECTEEGSTIIIPCDLKPYPW